MLAGLEVGLREGVLVHAEPEALSQARRVAEVEFVGPLGGLLVFEEKPHELVVLGKEDVLSVRQVMLVGVDLLDDPGLRRAILLRVDLRRHHPLELRLLGDLERPPDRGRGPLGLDPRGKIRATLLIRFVLPA